MSFTSRLVHWLRRLPPAETHDIAITCNLQVPMPDGVVLLADLYAPRLDSQCPTILMRTPYGRRGFLVTLYVLPYVAQKYQVLVQSCRGTNNSGGTYTFARDEHDDGLATIAWIKQQKWFSGKLVSIGESYLGFAQWSIAAEANSEFAATVGKFTTSDFNHFRFQGGSFTLETFLNWGTLMTEHASNGLSPATFLFREKRARHLAKIYQHVPLGDVQNATISQSLQEIAQYGPDDEHWKPLDYSGRVGDVTTPTYLMSGWYDLFLDGLLKDYQTLHAAGRRPFLLIGPWTHLSSARSKVPFQESLAWLRAHLKDDQGSLRRDPVRLCIMGANEWRDFATWPPPTRPERWYLQADGILATTLPCASEPDGYLYDPADPTPAVGGNSLGKHMGARDNRPLEARPDVLVYTSAILEQDLEIIGAVTAELYVRSSLEHTDFFARLCVVKASGESTNLCDSILRLTPGSITPEADGNLHISIQLWPTAYRFLKGERLRVQVSSGAFPRFARNLGTGEALATGKKFAVARQMIYHDPRHPSAFVLPVSLPEKLK